MFFGESMFAREKDASKVAFFHLVRQITAWEFNLIDCQIMNDHLASLGATSLPRSEFMALLAENRDCLTRSGSWTFQS
jgi:leucyl/phenylalanyl-tRNA--protein transferase